MTSVLFVVSAADRWTLQDGSTHPTGFWAEEVAEPHRIFTDAGFDITIATPGGVAPTLDQRSLSFVGGTPWKRRKIKAYLDSIREQLNHPQPLDQVRADDYDLVFYPGGHGPMEDLAYDATSGGLLTARLASGKPLAMLCHAPAASLAAKNPDDTWSFTGYHMTGLSNVEEKFNGFAKKAKWLLQDKLQQQGARYSKALLPMRPHVVRDRSLFTGQNPQSSRQLAERLVKHLSNN